VRNNSRDEGMEAWWTGGQLAVRLRYGKPVRRRPEGNEIDRLREDIFGAPGAYYDVVERFADLQPGGPTQQLGRPARLVQVRLRGTPRPAAPEPEPGRKWRSQVQVQALTGQVGVDEKTGVPLFVELRARYTYSKGNARAEVDMQVRRELAEIGAVANVAPPTDAIDSPTRTRYEVEKRELLDGLAADRQQSGR
jgi:hypothetical protein